MMTKSDEKAKNTPGQSYSFGTSNRSGGITIQDDSVLESRKKSGCCGGGGNGDIVDRGVHSQKSKMVNYFQILVPHQIALKVL